MSVYSCEKCLKTFPNKSSYESHNKRKTPCIKSIETETTPIKTIDSEKTEVELVESINKPKKKLVIVKKLKEITETVETEPTTNSVHIDVQNICGLEYLKTINNNSIDLVLTDPPYIISKDSGMNEHYNNVKFMEENDITEVKTEEEWEEYKLQNNIEDDTNKEKYIKYGSIYGKKYCVKTDYGNWDSDFTMQTLENFVCEYYKKLKKGGTLIMFFDLWKITDLKIY